MNFRVGDIIRYNKKNHFLILQHRADINYFCFSYTILVLEEGRTMDIVFYSTDNLYVEKVA